MDSAERNSLLQQLDDTRDALLAVIADVSEHQSQFKPSPNRWSIAEGLEHVILAERGMYLLVIQNYTRCEFSGNTERERVILDSRGGDRSRRISAPEFSRPTSVFRNLEDARVRFISTRAQTKQYLAACEDDLCLRSTTHPSAGPINCQECLALIIVHPLRHVAQILEIKNSLQYPRHV